MKKIKITKGKTLLIVLAFVCCGVSFMAVDNLDNKNFEISKNLDIYYTLFRELNTFYVDDVNPGELVKESIDKMLASLDPYTNYIPESDIEDFRFMTTGEYGGIGALISKHGNDIVVAEPYYGFPAQKAGLRAGDVFLEISGKQIANMNTEDVSTMLKGAAGQSVKIKVSRYGEKKPLEFDVVREKITIDPVSYKGMIDEKTGYIHLSNFTKDCAEKVKIAMLELKDLGAQNMILDLRGNPGGLLVESVNLCNLFIGKGQEVVSTRGKVTQWDKKYLTTVNPVDTIMPLVVLVNRGSASASEIVSGSMQDLDRGVLIGTRTFGKGLVQTTRDLSYNAKLKVTTAKYYIPSGRCIQALDYSHRNEDGSVGNIPDSLKSEFLTKNGRKVYDGGGVLPDIVVEPEELGNLSVSLLQQNMFFDFATQFRTRNETIPEVENFEIDDNIYNQFVDFVKNSKFDYTSDTEDALKELIKTAKDERYFEYSKNEFAALESSLTHSLDHDLKEFRGEVSELLKDEIVSRYYYQAGAVKASLAGDKEISKALEILGDGDKYKSILKGN